MSNYTALRFKVTIKEEYRPLIDIITNELELDEFMNLPEEDRKAWMNSNIDTSFLAYFAKMRNASSLLPDKSITFEPKEWKDDTSFGTKNQDEFMETGIWSFVADINNGEDEIDVFFKEILPVIIESAEHIEVINENDKNSTFYELVNGKIRKKELSDETKKELQEIITQVMFERNPCDFCPYPACFEEEDGKCIHT